MKIAHTDIDIDVADRDALLSHVKHVRAYGDKDGVHKVGIYAQSIPYNPIFDAAAIDYKKAEDHGFFKFDIINNSVYENVRDDEHLRAAMKDPDWSHFENRNIVSKLVHIHSYSAVVAAMKPTSIDQLAMLLATIRPAKKHLMGKAWHEMDGVWDKPSDGEYYFKKAHAIAFAMSIVVQLNILVGNDA